MALIFSVRTRRVGRRDVRCGFCTVRLSNVGPKRDAGLGIDHRDACGTRRHRFIRARRICLPAWGRRPVRFPRQGRTSRNCRSKAAARCPLSAPCRQSGVAPISKARCKRCSAALRSRPVIDIDGAGGETFGGSPGRLSLGVDRHAAEENQQSDSDKNTRERLQRTHSLPHGRRPMQPQSDLNFAESL